MLKLSCKIEIYSSKKWVFDKIAACKIVRDSDMLISTCEITIPRKMKWGSELECPLMHGDRIKVYLGYDNNNELAFEGYIVKIGLKAPIILYCEDEMSTLKAKKMDYAILNGGVQNRKMLESFTDKKVRAVDFELNEFFRSSCENVAGFLDYVKTFGPDKYFFRYLDGENTLVCLHAFSRNLKDVLPQLIYDDSVNLIDATKLDVFKPRPDSVYVCINVLASSNSKRVRIERGVKDNASKRFIYHKYISNEAIANRLADYIIKRESQTGLIGTFIAFGGKLAWPFDVAAVKLKGERMGRYIIKKNIISFGSKGFRQQITIGEKIDE